MTKTVVSRGVRFFGDILGISGKFHDFPGNYRKFPENHEKTWENLTPPETVKTRVKQWCPEMCQKTAIFVKNPENGKIGNSCTLSRLKSEKTSILTRPFWPEIIDVFWPKWCFGQNTVSQ